MSSRVLVSLRIDAPPDIVFDAFTRDIASWWQPNRLFAFSPDRPPGALRFEPREGGRFTETYPDGEVFEVGRVLRWVPSELLRFTWRQASFAPDQRTEVEVRFDAVEAGRTRVTVEHTGWDSVPQAHVARHTFPDQVFLQRHGEWWQALLRALKGRSEPD
ncbi:SRPBCC domain-containing protein [Burkholderia alba]|uniref:SRPBCC domain-containing protein n=1 Tax=Burkholderia alba TaxID=2683677 RepID=UPI002B0575F1|nr:SRPBCC domain-containing protein [Burkholderia alba]